MTLYHVGIIEGYLAAHSPQPPQKIMDALTALREEYEQPQGAGIPLVVQQSPVAPVKHPAIQVPDDLWAEVDKPVTTHVEAAVDDGAEPVTLEASKPEKKPRKPYPPRTEEQKRELRERLTKNKAKAAPAETPPQPRKDTPADQLVDRHRDYAGEREDKTLVDADWGDIRTMKRNGMPMPRIAKSYGVELEYLVRFVAQQEDKAAAKNF